MFELINNQTNQPVLMNKELQRCTDKVIQLNNMNVRNDYHIAAIFAQVEQSGCFTDDGFKTAIEWGMKCIGYKKAQCYNYLKVGKEFVREVISNKGKTVGYCSNLLPIPGDDANRETTSFGTEPAPAPDKDFTMSQAITLSRLENREQALNLIHDGKVNPDMSVRDIKKVVDGVKNPDNESEQEETNESTETAKPAKKSRNLSKVETADLINELIRRGFRVSDNDGHIWESDNEPESEKKEGEANAEQVQEQA